jgi:hypothetical protein
VQAQREPKPSMHEDRDGGQGEREPQEVIQKFLHLSSLTDVHRELT